MSSNSEFSGLSIIIPVYNAEQTIETCLQSILSQPFANFEVICIDDSSSDRSADIVHRASLLDSRITLQKLPENRGAPRARNIGIEMCNGEYLAFMDADDEFTPNSLESLWSRLQELNSDAIKGLMYVSEDRGTPSPHPRNQKREWLNTDLKHCPEITHLYQYQSYVFRTALIRDNSLRFDEELRNFQDPVFMAHLLPLCSRIDVTLAPLYIRHDTPDSITTSTWSVHNFLSLINGTIDAYSVLTREHCTEAASAMARTPGLWWRKLRLMPDLLSKQDCYQVFEKIREVCEISEHPVSSFNLIRLGELHALTLISEGAFDAAYTLMQSALAREKRFPKWWSKIVDAMLYFKYILRPG